MPVAEPPDDSIVVKQIEQEYGAAMETIGQDDEADAGQQQTKAAHPVESDPFRDPSDSDSDHGRSEDSPQEMQKEGDLGQKVQEIQPQSVPLPQSDTSSNEDNDSQHGKNMDAQPNDGEAAEDDTDLWRRLRELGEACNRAADTETDSSEEAEGSVPLTKFAK